MIWNALNTNLSGLSLDDWNINSLDLLATSLKNSKIVTLNGSINELANSQIKVISELDLQNSKDNLIEAEKAIIHKLSGINTLNVKYLQFNTKEISSFVCDTDLRKIIFLVQPSNDFWFTLNGERVKINFNELKISHPDYNLKLNIYGHYIVYKKPIKPKGDGGDNFLFYKETTNLTVDII